MSATLTPPRRDLPEAVASGRGGLTRTVLRLHRTALLAWTGFVVVTLGWLVWSGKVDAQSILDHKRACDDLCAYAYEAHRYSVGLDRAGLVIGYASLGVAAFAGGALIGRELESGTAHLAWTQGVSPARWLVAKLAVPAVAVVAGSAVLVAVYRWTRRTSDALLYNKGWSEPGAFVASGPATTAYALCALALGALAALLIGRTLPALAAGFTATALLQGTLFAVRPDLWPAKTVTTTTWPEVLNSSWRLASHGDTTTYHPRSHFWPLHLMETGLVLTVTVAATAAAFWTLHRRTTPGRQAETARPPQARAARNRPAPGPHPAADADPGSSSRSGSTQPDTPPRRQRPLPGHS
ncbi:hypothetical protein IAG44_22185 [Streptomyces roseirectus]|uniref:ABC transporter permease n=1 Tax=Streptomyces roseirectus TaxID=2768066 RepID=A0A7H0IGD8_9ACTN|nr:hypothetical protein [Streptomyces roseirectus]QNP71854.1 hypothetical protein IAG44_22185 [Streptomyces roseirectus]